jgi:hypothetical protein
MLIKAQGFWYEAVEKYEMHTLCPTNVSHIPKGFKKIKHILMKAPDVRCCVQIP